MKSFLICLIFFLSSFSFSFGQNPREHVYSKERLILLKDSVTVEGIITLIHPEIDGDYHLRLKIKETNLLVKRNDTKQDGCLVLEIVCGKGCVFTACNEYKNCVPLPRLGDLVRVTGVYVFDNRHRWNEIHPVLNIYIINSIVEK